MENERNKSIYNDENVWRGNGEKGRLEVRIVRMINMRHINVLSRHKQNTVK